LVWIYFRTGTRIMSNFTKLMAQAAAGAAGGGGFYPYTVDYSCRFYGNDKLTWTAPSGGNRKTFTISLWAKPAIDGTGSVFFNVDGSGAGDSFGVDHQSGGYFYAFGYSAALSYYQRQQIDQLYRDPSAWYHWVFAYDTTATTTADRFKIYVNGVELDQSNWTNITTFPLNADTGWNESGRPHEIGEYADDVSSTDTHMYMAQFAVVDGQQLDASSFGEFKNGIWVPKDLSSLTWGNNGFWLDFADSSNLGNDVSGNNNDFTSSGLTSSDQMIDTPTNNFATWNSLIPSTVTYSEGNIKALPTGVNHSTLATQGFSSGKYYWECRLDSQAGAGYSPIGVTNYGSATTWYSTSFAVWTYINQTGGTSPGATTTSSSGSVVYHYDNSGTYTAGQIIMCAVDIDAGKIWWGVDGTWIDDISGNVGNPSTGANARYSDLSGTIYPIVGQSMTSGSAGWNANFGQNGTFNGLETAQGNTDANGVGDFYYTVPTGFLSLCTANILEPTIGPNIDSDDTAGLPEEQFNILLYEGNSTNDRDITGVGFDPDFGIFKNRDEAYGWIVVDRNRGDGWSLGFDTGPQESGTGKFDSFITDGYRIDSHPGLNRSSIVNYSWKAGGTASSNTDGDITSTVSANTDAGISVITYTGNASYGQTVGHDLGVAPQVVICKNLSNTRNWRSYFETLGATKYINLDESGAAGTYGSWNNTAPTSSVFSTTDASAADRATNYSGDNFVAYCFAEVEGFSSFGSYTGNGSADGPFIYTGFRPAFLVIKQSNGNNSWNTSDGTRTPYNGGNDSWLNLNLSNAESNSQDLYDYLSNGFKLRSTSGGVNGSSSTYIYMAFAENPFKYANAR